jgi:hypothetical protein
LISAQACVTLRFINACCNLTALWQDVSAHADHAEDNHTEDEFNTTSVHRLRRSASTYQCTRTNIVGMLVQKSSPYLFPCTIEYSLICAVTLYEMWKHIKCPPAVRTVHHVCGQRMSRDYSNSSLGKSSGTCGRW